MDPVDLHGKGIKCIAKTKRERKHIFRQKAIALPESIMALALSAAVLGSG